jgi:hypothetical protein
VETRESTFVIADWPIVMIRFSCSGLTAGALVFAVACDTGPAALTELVEARRLASDLQVQFAQASDASNRAVMADTDEASLAAAAEAKQARQGVERVVLELRVPHIAEAEDEEMDRMEGEMAKFAVTAREGIQELKRMVPPTASPDLDTAAAALERFVSINKEVVTLSRRNSDVRSLALSLGRKRRLAAECLERLQSLDQALARHRFTATR